MKLELIVVQLIRMEAQVSNHSDDLNELYNHATGYGEQLEPAADLRRRMDLVDDALADLSRARDKLQRALV